MPLTLGVPTFVAENDKRKVSSNSRKVVFGCRNPVCAYVFSARAHEALVTMGAPVFHGGFSTFTAFVLTSTSDSYVFTTFFKVDKFFVP